MFRRLWNKADGLRFIAIALGVFLGFMISSYVIGFTVTDENIVQDAAYSVGARTASNVQDIVAGDARMITFEIDGQYGYAAYVRHPLFPLYRRTLSLLHFKALEPGDIVAVEDFHRTYLIGTESGEALSTLRTVEYTSLGFNWVIYVLLLIILGALLAVYRMFRHGFKNFPQ